MPARFPRDEEVASAGPCHLPPRVSFQVQPECFPFNELEHIIPVRYLKMRRFQIESDEIRSRPEGVWDHPRPHRGDYKHAVGKRTGNELACRRNVVGFVERLKKQQLWTCG
jgi:hypothetical protein